MFVKLATHAVLGPSRVHWVPFLATRVRSHFVIIDVWLIEPRMKSLFFTLVTTLRFESAVDPETVMREVLVVTRPFIKGEEGKGAQLPMYVSLVDEE